MLNIRRKEYEALRQHGEETYPHECCGVLLGQMGEDGARSVTSVARAGNTRTDSAHNRYNIDPKELIRIQRHGREHGQDIIGFYLFFLILRPPPRYTLFPYTTLFRSL